MNELMNEEFMNELHTGIMGRRRGGKEGRK